MDSFQLNKYAMAFLGVIFLIMSMGILSETFFHSEAPKEAGYKIEVPDATAAVSTDEPTKPAYEEISSLLASADIDAGSKVFKKCAACHTADEGGKNKVGPNLYNIVASPIAAIDGFGYSGALKEYANGKTWTYEELNGFLFKPKAFVKGTAMGFAGLKKAKDRANLIAWMRAQAGTPAPLPGQ